jgi:hypothetical protein
MEYSAAGFLGAFLGVVAGAAVYLSFIGVVVGRLRALDRSATAVERAEFERKLSLMRRIVLATDVVAFGALGYWLGDKVG